MSELNIYQRVNKVMSQCDYLQKKQAQQGKGIQYDEVMAMIRGLLVTHGIVMVTTQESLDCLGNVEGTKQKIYQGKYSLKLVNMDNPTDLIEHTAYAQGMDGGDKGAGKAHTYAMKTMIVKGFGLETGIDEESRAEKIERLNEDFDLTDDLHNMNSAASLNELLAVWSLIFKKFEGKKVLIELTACKDKRKKQLISGEA
tara:strand:+ start:3401 stop:3997 length:597 start_codon:yes stop_codon:yes gene_type:complete